ncbi:MAG: hypothetical protein AAGG57_19455 [Pseudomonadota bacterium]
MALSPKKPKDTIGHSARGGISLSRAKRLSDTVDDRGGRKSKWLMAGSGVVLIATVALFLAQQPASIDGEVIASETGAANLRNTETSTLLPAGVEAVETPALVEVIDPPTETPSVQRTIQPSNCVSAARLRLANIKEGLGARVVGLWSDHKRDVNALIQLVVDCRGAAIEIDGSLELIEVGLARLHLLWDPSRDTLVLTTIMNSDADQDEAPSLPTALLDDTGRPTGLLLQ